MTVPAAVEKPALSRIEGCVIGLAVGDALGMPTEGLTRHEIRARWGRVSDFIAAADLRAGQYTDETQSAIALAESIARNRGFDPEAAASALRDWCAGGDVRRPSPGTAQACVRLTRGTAWSESGSDSADCAAAAPAALIGLLHCRNPEKPAEDAAAATVITHRDQRAVAGAVAMAAAVAYLVRADVTGDVPSVLDHAASASAAHSREMAAAIKAVGDLLDLAPRMAMDEIGYSGFAVEAVPAAFYCFAVTPDDFAESVLLAVNTGGRASSIAAMTGALGGAHLGLEAIPSRWVEGVEGSQRLRQLARELHALA
jgi:ADP-ribosylglycohydrolase